MRFESKGFHWPRLGTMVAAISCALSLSTAALAADSEASELDIPPQGLDSALRQVAKLHNLQLVFMAQEVSNLQTAQLKGRFTAQEAIGKLIEGTNLVYLFNGQNTVVIRPRIAQDANSAGTGAQGPKVQAALLVADKVQGRTSLTNTDAGDAAVPNTLATTVEEVIITAQKRSEPLQKTPIAVTAFTMRDLETQRVSNVMDLMNKVPSVNIVPFTGTRAAPNLFIRGMGNTNTQSTKDLATGVYIDGVPIGRGMGLAVDIADLERVEVLRGPQGTLYGRNTTAGAINYITQKPDSQLSFEQQLTAGNYDLFATRTRLNVPITDQLYARLAYMHSTKNGWVENTNSTLPNQTNFNEDDKEAIKLAVRYTPSSSFTVDYGFDSSKLTYGNNFFQVVAGPTARNDRQEKAPAIKGLSPSEAKVAGNNLTLTWDLESITLKSITAYRKLDSMVNQNYIDIFTQVNKQDQHQVSQEFQLIGDALDNRIQYVTGLFYFSEESNEYVSSNYGGPIVDTWAVEAESKSAALYGQAAWTPPILNDRLRLTLGARYTNDNRKATKTFIQNGFTPTAAGTVVSGEKNFDTFNPNLTLDYAFSDNVNGYGKISTGYRAGGFNTQSTIVGFGNGFNEENVRAYEVGLKSDLFEKRLRLNTALFLNKYSDLQVDQVRVPPIFADTLNAGRATVKGVEIEMSAVLARGLTANLFSSFLNAKYQSYVDNGVDLASSKRLPNTPKQQMGVGIQYELPQTTYGKPVLNVDYRRQSSFYSGVNPNTQTAGYAVWNARLQLMNIRAPKGSFRVALWAKNLTDQEYRLATSHLGLLSSQYGEPRTVGIDTIYEF